jgi:hypothetical protein
VSTLDETDKKTTRLILRSCPVGRHSKIVMSWLGLQGLRCEALRMPSGPNRAPARKEVSVSKGATIIATSLFYKSCTFGSRIKVCTP